jgi:hypothetical protein
MLGPFRAQSVRVASVIALGWRWLTRAGRELQARGDGDAEPAIACDNPVLCRVTADSDDGLTIAPPVPIPPGRAGAGGGRAHGLDSLARRARELSKGGPGAHVLLLSGRTLQNMIEPLT